MFTVSHARKRQTMYQKSVIYTQLLITVQKHELKCPFELILSDFE